MLEYPGPITFATGPRACGKSTILKILCDLMNTDKAVFVDTSDIIDYHLTNKTELGRKLAAFAGERTDGSVMTCDDLIIEAVKMWMNHAFATRGMKHAFIGGSPRSVIQATTWKKRPQVKVLHIHADDTQITESIMRRQVETGKIRPEEAGPAIEKAKLDYREKILPGVQIFNGHALTLDRSEPLTERVLKALGHIHMPDNVRARCLSRLKTRDHPVVLRIREIESPIIQKAA